MFKAVIKAETLKSVIYVVGTVVDEVKLVISPDEVRIRAIDSSHVAMLGVTISASAFTTYEADNVDIGLDLEKFKTVLKIADSSDDVFLEQDVDQGRLVIRIGSVTRRMNLVDTTTLTDPRDPKIETPNCIKIGSEVLKKGIKAAENIDDAIVISATPEYFELACEGDTDYASLRVSASECAALEVVESVCCMFPIDNFNNIIKVIPDKTEVSLCVRNEQPIKLLFALADGTINFVYFLAPRIERE